MNKLEATNTLLKGMFTGWFNANDFFYYASAMPLHIAEEDFYWIIEHIEKHGNEGLEASMAYVQNQEPIAPYLTDKFKAAIEELSQRKQEVSGDIDWEFYHYNDKGPYRTINKD